MLKCVLNIYVVRLNSSRWICKLKSHQCSLLGALNVVFVLVNIMGQGFTFSPPWRLNSNCIKSVTICISLFLSTISSILWTVTSNLHIKPQVNWVDLRTTSGLLLLDLKYRIRPLSVGHWIPEICVEYNSN